MKTKKTPPRRRISFAVDRDEIEINSDWVQAVMARPAEPVAAKSADPPADAQQQPEIAAASPPPPLAAPHGPESAETITSAPGPSTQPSGSAASFINNATAAESSTGAECTSVEISAAVENRAPVEQSAAVVDLAPVSGSSTVEDLATVENKTTANWAREYPERRSSAQPVAVFATEANFAPGQESISTEDHPGLLRKPRPRPIHRITDGLTPGQYAVYSLMYEAGEALESMEETRIYRGGYADLCRLTGLSKRGIQNIVGELQEKGVIGIHQAPGYHRTETSAYRVPAPAAVVRNWHSRGLRFALGKSKRLVASVPGP